MKIFKRTLQTVLILLISSTIQLALANQSDKEVVDAFVQSLEQTDSMEAELKTEVDEIIAEYQDSAADAITESLVAMFEGYGDAIETSDSDDTAETIAALQPFADAENKFLAADASFYLARSLMNAEQFELAIPLLERVRVDLADFNVHVGKAQFYTGVAQAGLLQYSDAIKTLTEFAEFNPNAPERLRVAAWRQVQQLRAIEEGKMADVYQRMDFSRRKLSQIEPGEKTQEEQKKIVTMLAKLIKEQEKKEASQSQSEDQKNTEQKQQSQPQQQQSQQQQQQGKSQKGGTSNNPNGKVVRKAYNDIPASPWSRLRDRSRDPANNAIKDKFPAKYRDIVERYYEAANGGSKK